MITRRSLVFSGMVATLACRKQRGDGYMGYAFVANEEGKAIAAVDLTAFAVTRHIRLSAAPTGVIASPDQPAVYALTPSTGEIHEINTRTLAVGKKLSLGQSAMSMRPSRDGKSIWVLGQGHPKLFRINLADFKIDLAIQLPEPAVDFDVSAYFEGSGYVDIAAVSHGPSRMVSIIDVPARRVGAIAKMDGDVGTVRLRSDGRAILAANTSSRYLSVLDARAAKLVVHLPLSIRPDNFCFNQDGGQLFITGEGRDAVVVVYPYYVPEVGETVLAGSRPGAMAASRQHLFVVNPDAGDVSILSILRRRVVAVTAVGAGPGYVTVTPDDEYALVLNQGSGDMAVIRIQGLQPDRRKSAALFTMIPVGSKPVSAVVKAV